VARQPQCGGWRRRLGPTRVHREWLRVKAGDGAAYCCSGQVTGGTAATGAATSAQVARLRRVWRASRHRHRGNCWRDEAAVCAGGATTAGAARSPVCVCGPVRGGGGRHSCAATTTQSARRRPSARASTGRQGTDGGGGELGFWHPGATMVLGHLGRKPR